jgi:peptidoglycan-associated lipoprotein
LNETFHQGGKHNMRSKILLQVIILAVITSVGLTGCKSWNKKKDAKAGDGTISPLEPKDIATAGGSGAGRLDIEGANQERGLFAPVNFAYDSAKVTSGEMGKLQAVANALKANSKGLLIEGHTDERGTAEYNRALGEKRALACMEELIKMGIPASRISTISYGKERPLDNTPSESGWAKNRRCEFVLITK